MSDVLAKICTDKRAHIAHQKATVSESELRDRIESALPPRGFQRALEAKHAAGSFALIAEIKKASPSKGLIRADFDPAVLAEAYGLGGAACLSVLTDVPYFQGDDAYLGAARDAVSMPALRKDFMLDPYQVIEARALGADCILLIMAALDDSEASDLEQAAHDLGMDVLVEVHNAQELDRALNLKSALLGINNRNLKTLEVSLETTIELSKRVPDEKIMVCESGLYRHTDLIRMAEHGAKTFLIGESLMRQEDVANATRSILGLAPIAKAS